MNSMRFHIVLHFDVEQPRSVAPQYGGEPLVRIPKVTQYPDAILGGVPAMDARLVARPHEREIGAEEEPFLADLLGHPEELLLEWRMIEPYI